MTMLATYAPAKRPLGSTVGTHGWRANGKETSPRPHSARRGTVEHGDPNGHKTVFKIAQHRRELYGAFRLVHEAYVRSGITRPNPYRMRVTPHHLLPTTEVFVALGGGEVLCTMTLVRDGLMGLPMEAIYEEEVERRRQQGILLGEVCSLADQKHALEASFPVVFRLMTLLAQTAKRRGVDELMITVHPHHAGFYERFAAFRPIGEEKIYPTVCDKPAVALAVDLTRLAVNNPHVHKRFFGKPLPEEILRHRPIPEELRSELDLVVSSCCDTETSDAAAVVAA